MTFAALSILIVAALAIASSQKWRELEQASVTSLESKRIEELSALERSYLAQQGSKTQNAAQELERLSNQALVSWQLGHFTLAETALKQAVCVSEKKWGADDPHTAVYLATMASILRDASKLGEAEAAAERVIVIDTKAFGTNSPFVVRDLGNAALLYQFDALCQSDETRRNDIASRSRAYLQKSENIRNALAK